jgi:hypothetical protein
MFLEEKTFTFRFTLEASFPEDYAGDADEHRWLREWEQQMKPELLKRVMGLLREHPAWKAHVRNRGISPEDEIEIVLAREY